MRNEDELEEATRLERLWSGTFGDEYTVRNATAGLRREAFWREIAAVTRPQRVLEVGCNVGGNLAHLSSAVPSGHVVGLDVNLHALNGVRHRTPDVSLVQGQARHLPFRDGSFDLVLTVGVLIHQPEHTLQRVMREILRCSSRYVLCAEYAAAETQEVIYRDHRGALFKRDYRALYLRLASELQVESEGVLGPEEGFDDVTWHLFATSRSSTWQDER